MFRPNTLPGTLIAVEGLDGSGKSTQLALLGNWLSQNNDKVFRTEWNSSPLVRSTIKEGKKLRALSPTTFCLLHSTDFADRFERQIEPLLHAGYTVLCDRYIFTAFARDIARGCDREWVRDLYSFAPLPDLTVYFRVPLEVARHRVLGRQGRPKFYEAGMDLGLSEDRNESFRLFQERILTEYTAIKDEFKLAEIDATLPPEQQQREFRQMVEGELNRNAHMKGKL